MFGFSLVALSIGFGVGLVIGWNVLPQPTWVRSLWERINS